MAKQKAPGWAGFLEGAALALVLYTAFQLLLAAAALRGILPESGVFRCQIASAALATLAGGLLAARRTPALGTLWAALASTGAFLAAVALLGFLACNGLTWTEGSGILLGAMAAGGLLAGLLGGRRQGGKKKRKAAAPVGGGRRKKNLL